MTPFHRPCALYSFLSVCNVTIVPSCTIFKLLEVEKYCELKSRLWVTHPSCQRMHDLYIGGSYRREAVFLPLIVWVYLHLLLHNGLAELWKKLQCCVTVVQRHSRSLEMAPFNRSHTSLYSPSIVTMAISCIVCEILRLIVRKSRRYVKPFSSDTVA